MMRKLFSLITLLILIFLITPSIAQAVEQVLGKEDAPGQIKKQETADVNVGTVEEVKPGKVKIKTKGKNAEIETDENTEIIEKPSGKKLAPGQIKKNDKIATFKKDAQATGSADLVLVKPATESAKFKKRRGIYGLVRNINGTSIVISHPIKDDPRYTIQVTENTFIKIKGVEGATIADISLNDRLTAVGNWDGDVLVVKRIHIIPGKATGLFDKIATDSASPAGTPSATPTATPSASPVVTPTPSIIPSPTP